MDKLRKAIEQIEGLLAALNELDPTDFAETKASLNELYNELTTRLAEWEDELLKQWMSSSAATMEELSQPFYWGLSRIELINLTDHELRAHATEYANRTEQNVWRVVVEMKKTRTQLRGGKQ